MKLMKYKFHANNAPLRELSQFTVIFIQIHNGSFMRGKHFSLFSCSVSTFLTLPFSPDGGEGGSLRLATKVRGKSGT